MKKEEKLRDVCEDGDGIESKESKRMDWKDGNRDMKMERGCNRSKRWGDAEAIIDSCKGKQPQLLVLLRSAQCLNGQSYYSPPRR